MALSYPKPLLYGELSEDEKLLEKIEKTTDRNLLDRMQKILNNKLNNQIDKIFFTDL